MDEPILLIHISDIHIKNLDNPILNRVELIIDAIRGQHLSPSDCFLVVPGDIAFSGKKTEYAIAEVFFTDLLARLRQEFLGVTPSIVFVPGNHDCDFSAQTDVRESGLAASKVGSLNMDGSFVKEFLAVQDEFNAFSAKLGQTHASNRERLHFRRTFVSKGDRTVAFTCFNTAWMSTNPEIPGSLLYPNHLHSPIHMLTADVEIAVVHHPANWLQPENGNAFADALERRYDIIITGHEHRHSTFAKVNKTFNCEYIAGRAMYDPRVSENGFNLAILAIADKTWNLSSFIWDGEHYSSSNADEAKTFLRNGALAAEGFQNNKTFLDYLTDIGTGFTHSKKHLRLNDLFIFPTLVHRAYQRNLDPKSASPRKVKSNDVIEFFLAQRRLLILGAERSGKTALARTVYQLLQAERQLVPVLLKGVAFTRDASINAILDAAYIDQYDRKSLEAFKRLSPERVCIIVDDLNRCAMSRKLLAQVIGKLEHRANNIFLFASETYDIDYVIAGTPKPIFFEYRQYVIDELNRVQRAHLIRKWVSLAHREWDDEDTFRREVDEKERTINTLLGRQLVPALPVIVIAFLQTMDSARNANTANGSYGELYEALITERLLQVSKKSTDLGIKYAVISRIAFGMFDAETLSVTRSEFERACDDYYAEYGLRLSAFTLIEQLLQVGVFRESDGNLTFFYPYYYHYFVARFIRDKVGDNVIGPILITRLEQMADRIYYEDYVNIIIFYLYLTKDTKIIERILANAERIYHKYSPCELEEDIHDLNTMSIAPPEPMVLLSEDYDNNREENRQRLDELEERSAKPSHSGEKLEYDDSLDELIKLNIAFKTIHILGQVLRNFPGDIKKDLKIRMAEQSYMLGLRIMSYTLGTISDNSEALRYHFTVLLQERHIEGSVSVLGDLATKALLNVALSWILAIIKTLSHSVGMEDLAETYKEVAAIHGNSLSVDIIDTSIKLDHFGAFPATQLEKLHRRVRKNYLAFAAVRILLISHYRLYRTSAAVRDRFGKMYEIAATKDSDGGLLKENPLLEPAK